MTISTPPWCLHWGCDGELTATDRQDVLSSIVRCESGLARLMLLQALQMDDCQRRQAPLARQDHANASMTI